MLVVRDFLYDVVEDVFIKLSIQSSTSFLALSDAFVARILKLSALLVKNPIASLPLHYKGERHVVVSRTLS